MPVLPQPNRLCELGNRLRIWAEIPILYPSRLCSFGVYPGFGTHERNDQSQTPWALGAGPAHGKNCKHTGAQMIRRALRAHADFRNNYKYIYRVIPHIASGFHPELDMSNR